jgi:hypothetical protein
MAWQMFQQEDVNRIKTVIQTLDHRLQTLD